MPEMKPGRLYRRDARGRLEETTDTERPEVVICRQVRDYAPAPVPAGASITPCRSCGALVASDPAGPYPDVPRICQRCAGIEPLPMPSN
jgi:hypothetical protein